MEALADLPLFEGVKRSSLAAIAQQAQQVRARPGDLLMLERFRGAQFLIILEGTASVRRGQTEIAAVGRGDFLGEIGLIEGSDRSATVVAQTPMKLLAFEGAGFRRLLDGVPAVGRRIREEAAARMPANEPRSTN
ncbi:MAG: cyclic nucleotide-binding domain-containing protein [Actinobacteria bacterium]|nr:cyclic nucleotide-binding domain-containing protein [Actinomycetota bacterium]